MLYSILRALANLIFKLLFRFKVTGRENLPKSGGFILASNHASYLDPIAVGIASFRKLNYMARHDLFFHPWFSWLLTHINVFAVRRNTADVAALKEAMRRVKNGEALLLFPEGRRMVNGGSVDPEAGIGFLAAKLDVPVIPVFVKGTEKALPKGAKFIRPAKVSVQIGKQIFIERRLPYHDIARMIMESIRKLS